MSFPYYKGHGKQRNQDGYKDLPYPRRDLQNCPEHYYSSDRLAKAVNVSLLLGQPLIVTGAPGSGKTQLAYRIAWELGFDQPLKFNTKSTSIARDLFYYFDSLARFHDQENKPPKEFITYHALGMAMILANHPSDVKKIVPTFMAEHLKPKRSVVLIDEIDKAPRDFPNDILNELESMDLHIPELNNAILRVPEEHHPVIIMTSNSEKNLPDAFMRRCVYFHIQFPNEELLQKIAENRLKDLAKYNQRISPRSKHFITDAIDLFIKLRDAGLKKKPATSELLVWLQTLQTQSNTENPVVDDPIILLSSLSALIKNKEDFTLAEGVIKKWNPKRNQ